MQVADALLLAFAGILLGVLLDTLKRTLFGPIGLALATPLMAVGRVAVLEVWVNSHSRDS